MAFVYALILMRTSMDPLLPGFFRQVDLLLPFVVYVAQRRSILEALILTLFCSHLYSLSSAAPIGVFTTHYLTMFIIVRLISYVLYATQWYSILMLLFSLSVLSHLNLVLTAFFFSHGWGVFQKGWSLLSYVFWTPIVGYLIYRMLDFIDRFTAKVPVINIELADGGV